MKFWEAMKIVDEGGKVRRKNSIYYIGLLKVRNVISIYKYGLTPFPFIPDHQDLDAEDWELFGDKLIIPVWIDPESDDIDVGSGDYTACAFCASPVTWEQYAKQCGLCDSCYIEADEPPHETPDMKEDDMWGAV